MRIPYLFLTAAVVALSALLRPLSAHNGAVAIAVPVEGITIDGDLSDWPEGMTRYEIGLPEYGSHPQDEADFQGAFRIGYNESENALYIAVEAHDQSIVVDTSGAADWSTQDGCEVYIDAVHGREHATPGQYHVYGESLGVSGSGARMPDFAAAMQRDGGTHRYEWRIDIERRTHGEVRLRSGMSLGMDVVLCDQDEDGSFSWVAWGPYGVKVGSRLRVGDLLIVDDPSVLGTVTGDATWTSGGAASGVTVRVVSPDSPQFLIHVGSGPDGTFQQALPRGVYSLGSQGDTLTVTVQPGQNRHISISIDVAPQGLTMEQVKINLVNNPPNIGDRTAREEALLALDGILLHDSSRTAESVSDFYIFMMKKAKSELTDNVSSTGAAIWMMYNQGFVVKTAQAVFAFDLVNGYSGWSTHLPVELIKQIKVLFVSHRHGDHYDSDIANTVLRNGGYVVVPSEDSHIGNVPMEPGDSLTVVGLHIKTHDGLHSVPLRVYEVTCPNGLRFVHTGDNQTSKTLPEIDRVDVLLLNAWVNESGAAPAVVGMRNSIDKLKPALMIPGHIQELGHDYVPDDPRSRVPYEWAFELDDEAVSADVVVMTWGERLLYDK